MSRYERYTVVSREILRAAGVLARANGRGACTPADVAGALVVAWPAGMNGMLAVPGPDEAAGAKIRQKLAETAAGAKWGKLPLSAELRTLLDNAETLAGSAPVEPSHLLSAGWNELRSTLSDILSRELPAEPCSFPDSADAALPPKEPLSKEDLEFLLQFGRELGVGPGLGEVVGRDEEIESVSAILLKLFKPNPLLLGEPGVGKTAVVEGFARRVAAGRVPDKLKGKRVFELRIGDLNAGTQFKGSFEERIKKLVEIVEKARDIIVFIDEFHLIGDEKYSQQLGNLLKPSLARGTFPCIGATTPEDYFRYLGRDEALTRRFQTVRVREPTRDETAAILESIRLREERHHGLAVDPPLVGEIVGLSDAFIRGRFFPDKAIDLFDRACALSAVRGEKILRRERIFEALSDIVGSPVAEGAASLDEAYSRLESVIRASVKGQDLAIDSVCAIIRLCKRRLDLRTERPDGVFLFVGPSGCGKTVLAESLAKAVSGGTDAFYRIDFSEYSEEISVSRLTGSSPGYVGYDDMPALAEAAERAGGGVILLDEFEKGHPRVRKLFLQLFDSGRSTLANGKTLDFSRATFVAATNIGSSARKPIGFADGAADGGPGLPMDALRAEYTSELLNRFDEIVPFRALDRSDCVAILSDIIVPDARGRIAREYAAILSVSAAAIGLIADRGYSPEFGARNLHRTFQELVLLPVTEKSGDIRNKRIEVGTDDGNLSIGVSI